MQPRTQSTLPVEEEEASGNEDTKEYGQILGCTVHIKCWMDYKKVELKFMRCVCVMYIGLKTMFSDDKDLSVEC